MIPEENAFVVMNKDEWSNFDRTLEEVIPYLCKVSGFMNAPVVIFNDKPIIAQIKRVSTLGIIDWENILLYDVKRDDSTFIVRYGVI